ncbi:MAG: class I SAM-dependent methyltransferase family protein [Thermoplasmata archaeon]
MLALRVDRGKAEDLRLELSRLNLLDSRRKFLVRDEFVEIPVLGMEGVDLAKWGAVSMEQEEPVVRAEVYDPHKEIVDNVQIPDDLIGLLPKKWEMLGDVLILKLNEGLREYDTEVAKVFAEVLGAVTVLEDVGGVAEDFRKPQVRLLLGERTVATHRENGVLYKLDAKEVMFSSGNIDERIRMAKVCDDGDVVVDMFAGIGYFSLPMAVHSRPEKVYSVEINPVAFGYLEENVKLNGVENVVDPILGDCLEMAPEGVATRVVMGYLSGEDYLPKAMRVIGERGTIHYHENCPNELLPDRPVENVEDAARKEDREIEVLDQRRIKSYAPGVSHVVLDVRVS